MAVAQARLFSGGCCTGEADVTGVVRWLLSGGCSTSKAVVRWLLSGVRCGGKAVVRCFVRCEVEARLHVAQGRLPCFRGSVLGS